MQRLSREYELRLLDRCDVLLAQVDAALAGWRDSLSAPDRAALEAAEREAFPLHEVDWQMLTREQAEVLGIRNAAYFGVVIPMRGKHHAPR